MDKAYNLDEGVSESFEFILKGNHFIFRRPTTEETEKLTEIKTEKEFRAFLFPFISKKDEKSPSFEELVGQMVGPNWKKFKEMIIAELGV